MKIRPLRTTLGQFGKLKKGVVRDIPDHYAQQLVRRGIAVPVQAIAAKGKAKAGKAGKGAAGTAVTNPRSRSRSGGRTGAAKPSSSSPAGPAPKTSRSTKRGDAPDS